MRRAILTLAVMATASCTISVPIEQVADDLRAMEIQTLTQGPGYTLISPYDAVRTADYDRWVRQELTALAALFDEPAASDAPLLIELAPVEQDSLELEFQDDDTIRYSGTMQPPSCAGLAGVAGHTSETGRPMAVVFVTRDERHRSPDGDEMTATFHFPDHERRTLRHELAHVFAARAKIDGPTWIGEGVATAAEERQLVDGTLLFDPSCKMIRIAARIHGAHELQRVLDWDENIEDIRDGIVFVEGRPLAGSFVAFLAQRDPELSFTAAVRAAMAQPPAELLAIEPDWHAWLADLAQ